MFQRRGTPALQTQYSSRVPGKAATRGGKDATALESGFGAIVLSRSLAAGFSCAARRIDALRPPKGGDWCCSVMQHPRACFQGLVGQRCGALLCTELFHEHYDPAVARKAVNIP